MSIFKKFKTLSLIIGLVTLSACCNGDYSDDTISLSANMSQNTVGQGVAAWESPGGDGIVFGRVESAGVWTSQAQIGSVENPITIQEISKPAVSQNGDQFVLWKSDDSSPRQHLNRYIATDDAWDSIELPTGLASNPALSLQAQIDTDDSGNAWLLWVDGNTVNNFGQIWVAHFDAATSTWDVANRLDNGTDTGQFAGIAVNDAGVAVATWSTASGDGLWANRYIAGAWETQTQVANGLAGLSSHQSLALDNTGNALMAWNRELSSTVSEVYAASFNGAAGTWSAEAKLDVDSFAQGKLPKVSMRGVAGYVAWSEGSQLWATRILSGSSAFDMPVSLTSSANTFSLVSTTDGRAYLSWHISGTGTLQSTTYLPAATGWSSFASVPASSEELAGLLTSSSDDAGNLTIIWEQQFERKHPDPASCDMNYGQVWAASYDVSANIWTQKLMLDSVRTN